MFSFVSDPTTKDKVDSVARHRFQTGEGNLPNVIISLLLFFLSSCASSDDDAAAIELNIEAASPTSRGKLLKASSRSGSEMSCLTHVTMQPAPSLPPFRPRSPYDPERIPASVFGKKAKDLNWSGESLFSLRMSNYEAFRQSNLRPEELLAYSPSLKVKSEDAEEEEEIAQVMKKKKTSVAEETNNIHGEKSLSPTPSAYSYPSGVANVAAAAANNVSFLLLDEAAAS
ncbi:hypothetical protein Bca52824_014546 [Brassica carinata]|uniref:Uncharacterized protein n=1 Tax=Brassica carinata TaxID=52824 RepID=A0A8X7W017_BRACI|nr:hypothetical protein Bca52824_014546 [Brassica carinata]